MMPAGWERFVAWWNLPPGKTLFDDDFTLDDLLRSQTLDIPPMNKMAISEFLVLSPTVNPSRASSRLLENVD